MAECDQTPARICGSSVSIIINLFVFTAGQSIPQPCMACDALVHSLHPNILISALHSVYSLPPLLVAVHSITQGYNLSVATSAHYIAAQAIFFDRNSDRLS